jgi:protein TonB
MANAMNRAASVAASIILLGTGVIAALTMSITLQQATSRDPQPIVVYNSPPVTPPATASHDSPPTLPHNVIADAQAQPVAQLNLVASAIGVIGDVVDPLPPEIADPHWLRRPTDLARYYPQRAMRMEMQGAVSLDCRVSTAGLLNCAIVSETPSGWGFGEAALRIAADQRMAPAMRDGSAVEGRYRMQVPFRLQ